MNKINEILLSHGMPKHAINDAVLKIESLLEESKSVKAVKYMIGIWDEVTDKTWRERPDHVQQKFLEAEKDYLKPKDDEKD